MTPFRFYYFFLCLVQLRFLSHAPLTIPKPVTSISRHSKVLNTPPNVGPPDHPPPRAPPFFPFFPGGFPVLPPGFSSYEVPLFFFLPFFTSCNPLTSLAPPSFHERTHTHNTLSCGPSPLPRPVLTKVLTSILTRLNTTDYILWLVLPSTEALMLYRFEACLLVFCRFLFRLPIFFSFFFL